MQYIHAIDLDNFFPCWNLGIDGKLRTPNYLAFIDAGLAEKHKTIDDFSIDELRVNGPQNCSLTPRTVNAIIKAAILRRGQTMVNGYDEEILVSEDTKDFIIKSANVELEFERGRRLSKSNNVSRLSCIWLAERTKDGEDHIKEMLGKNVYILKVRVSNELAMSRVDTGWFDTYWSDNNPKYIENYWLGKPSSNSPKWEYLLDGEIEVEDSTQLVYIKQNGNRNP